MKLTDEELRVLVDHHAMQVSALANNRTTLGCELRDAIARLSLFSSEIGKNPEPMK